LTGYALEMQLGLKNAAIDSKSSSELERKPRSDLAKSVRGKMEGS